MNCRRMLYKGIAILGQELFVLPGASHVLTLHLSQAWPVRVDAESFFFTELEKSAEV